jgi:hypothetical protein
MNLLILDGHASGYSNGNPCYRGTYRAHPYYCEEYPPEHEVNQAFFWFLSEGGERGVVHDIAQARGLVHIFTRHNVTQPFEVVEVTVGDEPPYAGKTFLGFDLSCGFNNSLLWWGLDLKGRNPRDESLRPLGALLSLVEEHFRPKLNANGLFDQFSIARFCLDCLIALQLMRPALWEMAGCSDYEVVGLYIVEETGIGESR